MARSRAEVRRDAAIRLGHPAVTVCTLAFIGLALTLAYTGGSSSHGSLRRQLLQPAAEQFTLQAGHSSVLRQVQPQARAVELPSRPASDPLQGLPQRPRLFLSYAVWKGLTNQLFCHLNSLILAYHLNATLLVPAGVSGEVAGRYRDGFSGRPDDTWLRQPPETFLNWDAMAPAWEGGPRTSMRIAKAADTSACSVVEIEWQKFKALPILLTLIAQRVQQKAQLFHGKPGALGCIDLRLGYTHMAIDFRRERPTLLAAMLGLAFPPKVVQLAGSVLSEITIKGQTASFNGAHLRIEGDWRAAPWKVDTGLLQQDPVGAYLDAMLHAGFTSTRPCYIASGIFSYYSPKDAAALKSRLIAQRVCSRVLHKELLLPPGAFEDLHSEELALVDFLVLAEAQTLVGDPRSSFTAFLAVHRELQGIARSTFQSVIEGAEWWNHL